MIYAVGDAHGEVGMLRAMLEDYLLPRLTAADTLVFLGDYIDRGPDTCGVIEILMALGERFENVVFLRGNHEQMLIDALDSPRAFYDPVSRKVRGSYETQVWLEVGGKEAMLSYAPDFLTLPPETYLTWWHLIPRVHRAFVRTTLMEFVTERYYFVHAGLVPPGQVWQELATSRERDPRLWIMDQFTWCEADFGRVVVFGHRPQLKTRLPLVGYNKVGLDTGAGMGGPLTAASFDPDAPPQTPFYTEIYQVFP